MGMPEDAERVEIIKPHSRGCNSAVWVLLCLVRLLYEWRQFLLKVIDLENNVSSAQFELYDILLPSTFVHFDTFVFEGLS